MASGFPGTEQRCYQYRGVSKSFKRTFAPPGAFQDSGGNAFAGFVGSQLLRESFTRPVESDFHIGDGPFVKVIGNHFQCPPATISRIFAHGRRVCLFGTGRSGVGLGVKFHGAGGSRLAGQAVIFPA
jgi:hypothetical protein